MRWNGHSGPRTGRHSGAAALEHAVWHVRGIAVLDKTTQHWRDARVLNAIILQFVRAPALWRVGQGCGGSGHGR
jgi:hypothetical protein